jgi:hypothetical protein
LIFSESPQDKAADEAEAAVGGEVVEKEGEHKSNEAI